MNRNLILAAAMLATVAAPAFAAENTMGTTGIAPATISSTQVEKKVEAKKPMHHGIVKTTKKVEKK